MACISCSLFDGSIAAGIAELSISDGAATSVELAVLSVSGPQGLDSVAAAKYLMNFVVELRPIHKSSAGFLLVVTVLFEVLFEIPPFLVALVL